MKRVLALIEQKRPEFEQLPFFQFLRDESIDLKKRLAFAPSVTTFAMEIRDLNRYIFREEPSSDYLQQIINRHTYEDDTHWLFFMEDIVTLGIDRPMQFSDSLKFLWSDETRKIRRLCSHLGRMTYKADPRLKLAVIEAMETTGNIFLQATVPLAEQLQAITKQEYVYLGINHLNVEDGHPLGTDNIVEILESIQLTEEIEAKAFELVEETFTLFAEMVDEMLTFGKTHEFGQPFVSQEKTLVLS